MEFSLPAWLGGLAGTIVAVALYVPAIRIVERRLRASSGPKRWKAAPLSRTSFQLMRRVILGIDIALSWLSWAIGSASAIGGKWAA